MNQEKYIGMDVHQATISVAVMDSWASLKAWRRSKISASASSTRSDSLILEEETKDVKEVHETIRRWYERRQKTARLGSWKLRQ
jgi:hypothetical protein